MVPPKMSKEFIMRVNYVFNTKNATKICILNVQITIIGYYYAFLAFFDKKQK